MTFRRTLAALCFGACIFAAGGLLAQEPGWSGSVLPVGSEAQQIRQQDILDRPYRPGHVYGNTVRRMHYRGHPFPVPMNRGYTAGRRFRR